MKVYVDEKLPLDAGVYCKDKSKPVSLLFSKYINWRVNHHRFLERRPNFKCLGQFISRLNNRLKNSVRYFTYPIDEDRMVLIQFVHNNLDKASLECTLLNLKTSQSKLLLETEIACSSLDEFNFFFAKDQFFFYKKYPYKWPVINKGSVSSIDTISANFTYNAEKQFNYYRIPADVFDKLSFSEFGNPNFRHIDNVGAFYRYGIRVLSSFPTSDCYYYLYRFNVDSSSYKDKSIVYRCLIRYVQKETSLSRGFSKYKTRELLTSRLNKVKYKIPVSKATDRGYSYEIAQNIMAEDRYFDNFNDGVNTFFQVGEDIRSSYIVDVVDDEIKFVPKHDTLSFLLSTSRFYSVHFSGEIAQLHKLEFKLPLQGDIFNNPIPDFIFCSIVDAFEFFDRLCIVTKDTLFFSSTGDYFNFFIKDFLTFSKAEPFSFSLKMDSSITHAFKEGNSIICMSDTDVCEVSFEDNEVHFSKIKIRHIMSSNLETLSTMSGLNDLAKRIHQESAFYEKGFNPLIERHWSLILKYLSKFNKDIEHYFPKKFYRVISLPEQQLFCFQDEPENFSLYFIKYDYPNTNTTGTDASNICVSRWIMLKQMQYPLVYNNRLLYLHATEQNDKQTKNKFISYLFQSTQDDVLIQENNLDESFDYISILELKAYHQNIPLAQLEQIHLESISMRAFRIKELKIIDETWWPKYAKKEYVFQKFALEESGDLNVFLRGRILHRRIRLEFKLYLEGRLENLRYKLSVPDNF